MQPNQRTMWFSIAGVVLLVALIIITPKLRNAPAAPAEPLILDEAKTEEVVANPKQDGGLAGPSYLEALEKYEASRVVFGADCKAFPVTQTFTVGTTVMLDNQSAVPHTIKVGDKIYQVGAYKYRTTNLPVIGPVAVHCDDTQNAAAFIVSAKKAE